MNRENHSPLSLYQNFLSNFFPFIFIYDFQDHVVTSQKRHIFHKAFKTYEYKSAPLEFGGQYPFSNF